MNGVLDGYKVLVTRPRQQGERLCQLVEAEGGIAIPFPTLELSPSKKMNRRSLLQLFAAASRVIFISRNAVEFAHQISGDLAAGLRGKKIIAVGDGTLRELVRHDVYDAVSPGTQSGSEELLEMPELEARKIAGSNVLIVRGGSGREFLHAELVNRGALVQYADVYERSEPDVTQLEVDAIWHRIGPDVIVFTSKQGMQGLIRMTAEQDRGIMFSKKLVVMSQRLAEMAGTAGFVLPACVATEQSDQGLLQAIRQTVE